MLHAIFLVYPKVVLIAIIEKKIPKIVSGLSRTAVLFTRAVSQSVIERENRLKGNFRRPARRVASGCSLRLGGCPDLLLPGAFNPAERERERGLGRMRYSKYEY